MTSLWKGVHRNLSKAVAARDVPALEGLFARYKHRIPPKSVVDIMKVFAGAGKVSLVTNVYKFVSGPGPSTLPRELLVDDSEPDLTSRGPTQRDAAVAPSVLDFRDLSLQFYTHFSGRLSTFEANPLEVPRLLEVLREDRHVPWCTALFNSLFRALSRAKRMDDAWHHFGRMRQLARKRPHCRPDSATYCTLLLGFAAADSHGYCEQVLTFLEQDTWVVWDPPLYAAVLEAFLPVKGVAFARQCHREMRERGIRPTPKVYDLLLQYCQRSKDYSDAVPIFHEYLANRTRGDAPLLDRMARALLKAGAGAELPRLGHEMQRRAVTPAPDLARHLLAHPTLPPAARPRPPTPRGPPPPRRERRRTDSPRDTGRAADPPAGV